MLLKLSRICKLLRPIKVACAGIQGICKTSTYRFLSKLCLLHVSNRWIQDDRPCSCLPSFLRCFVPSFLHSFIHSFLLALIQLVFPCSFCQAFILSLLCYIATFFRSPDSSFFHSLSFLYWFHCNKLLSTTFLSKQTCWNKSPT